MPINLTLNDQPLSLKQPISLEQAVTEWNLTPNTFAIAINNMLITRNNYATTIINNGDQVEVVTAMQGG
jgi:sulfur carrier protein